MIQVGGAAIDLSPVRWRTVYTEPDADGGGSSAEDPMSFLSALQLAQTGLDLTIVMATGDYGDWPLDSGYQFPQRSMVTLEGTYVDSGLGSKVVTSWTSATAGLVVTGGGLTAHAWMGARIRFTSGTHSGAYFTIYDNNTTTLFLSGERSDWDLQPGDTFVIERAGNTITQLASKIVGWNGSKLTINGLKFTTDGNTTFVQLGHYNCEMSLQGLEIYAPSGGNGLNWWVQSSTGDVGICYSKIPWRSTTSEHGVYVHGFDATNRAGIVFWQCSDLTLTAFTARWATVSLYLSAGQSGDYYTLNTNWVVSQSKFYNAYTNIDANYNLCPVIDGSKTASEPAMWCVESDVSFDTGIIRNAPGAALRLTTCQGYISLDTTGLNGLGGSGNAVVGVKTDGGGPLVAFGSSGITGTAGDLKIGGNAGVTTWAQVAAGAKTDIAAAAPQLCSAIPWS